MAKLMRKFAQAHALSPDPQAIELHKPGIVQLDRNACPESVEVIGFAISRHGRVLATEWIAARILRAFGPAGVARS